MDVRTYVTLEQSLIRTLRKNWTAEYAKKLTKLGQLVEDQKFDDARALVLEFDLSTVGNASKQYIRQMGKALVLFGANSVSGQPGVMLNPNTTPFIDQTTDTFLMFLEHSGTRNLHRQLLQLIARAESADMLVKKAERKVKPFVSFDEAGNEQMQLISSLHSSRLAVWGFTAEAEVEDITRYRLDAVLDGRTSDFCRMIHGKEFNVSDARSKVMQVLSAQDPDDLKTLQPWPSQSKASIQELSDLSEKDLVGRGLHIPPFHPGCRTLLSLVSKVSRLSRPLAPQPSENLKVTLPSAKDFEAVGVDLTPPQVDHWNAYLGVSPSEWLGKTANTDPLKAFEGSFGKNAIKIKQDGDIITQVKGVFEGSKYNVGTIFDPLSGKFYLDRAEFLAGDAKAEANFMKGLLGSLLNTGATIGGRSLVVAVGTHAYEFAKLGFTPSAAKWQEIRLELLDSLTDGPLKNVLASLNEEQQSLLLNLLGNPHESALGVLVDVPWTYRGKYIGDVLLDGVSGSFELDLSSQDRIEKALSYLK